MRTAPGIAGGRFFVSDNPRNEKAVSVVMEKNSTVA